MGITTVDLFRSGNAGSACMDKVRVLPHPNPEIDRYITVSGDVWVRAGTGGISTSEAIDPIWTGRPWKLPMGSSYSDLLSLVNDGHGHWTWEPAADMLLTEYRRLLADLHLQFCKAWP